MNLKDKNGFPGSEGREVSALWTAKDGCVRTAKLEGSLVSDNLSSQFRVVFG